METLKIIKIGGNIIDDDKALSDFIFEFSKIKGLKVLVHGGGKLASKLANQMGIEVKMANGRQISIRRYEPANQHNIASHNHYGSAQSMAK